MEASASGAGSRRRRPAAETRTPGEERNVNDVRDELLHEIGQVAAALDERISKAAEDASDTDESLVQAQEALRGIDRRVAALTERVQQWEDQEATPNGLALAKARAMASIERVEKRGHNPEQNYAYATIGDVAETVRRAIAAESIAVTVEIDVSLMWTAQETGRITGGGRKWMQWTVPLLITLTHGPSGVSETVHWVGIAEDYSDKGLYKALSGGYKYWLIDTFVLSTGDDPESTDQSDQRAAPGAREPADQRPVDRDRIRRQVYGSAGRAQLTDDVVHGVIRYLWPDKRSVNDLTADEARRVVGNFDRAAKDPEVMAAMLAAVEAKKPEWEAQDAAAAAESGDAPASSDDPPEEPPPGGQECPDCNMLVFPQAGQTEAEALAEHRGSADCIPF